MAKDLYLHDASLHERQTESRTVFGWEAGAEVRTYRPDHPEKLEVVAQVVWLRPITIPKDLGAVPPEWRPVFRYSVGVFWHDGHTHASFTGTDAAMLLHQETALFSQSLERMWAHVINVAEDAMYHY